MKQTTGHNGSPQKTGASDNKRYGHRTQVTDTGKALGGVIAVFFQEIFSSILFIFSLIKKHINERNNRKTKEDRP